MAAAYTAGGSLAVTGAKVAGKEALEEVGERLVRETLEEAGEKAAKEGGEALGKKAGKELIESLGDDVGDIARVITKTPAEKAQELLDNILKKFDPKKASNKQKGNFGEIASQNNMLKNPNLKRIGDNALGS